ncbi:hypothetical protein F2Q69_00013664 [Brassica cretica]|uniref:Uncharacterized protein n=1 Tax=Brassica cretica TaxID=69181 RepID=A0A8S9QXS2_BRACR|nr:hypothetical protein F2Q69_00013664 [Brassica cretica]
MSQACPYAAPGWYQSRATISNDGQSYKKVNSNPGDVFDNPSDNEYDLDLSDDKEDREFSSEQSMDPSYGVFKDEADVSSDRFVPNYDKFDEDAMKQVTLAKVEDESVNFSELIYAQETPTLSHEDFATSDGVKNNFDLKDTTHPLFPYLVGRLGRARLVVEVVQDFVCDEEAMFSFSVLSYGEIYSDRVLHNTVDKDPSYEEENERLPEEAEDVKSFLFTRWHISNEPPDPGRSESLFNHVWSYSLSAYEGYSCNKFLALPLEDIITQSRNMCSKITRASDFVSSNIENHTKKIENVLYLTTSGNKFGNVALSFCWESEYELWNVSIVNSTKLFSSSDKARDEKFCEANKRKGSVFCEELYDATRQLNLWNKNYSHGLMCGLSTERVNTAHYPTVFDGFDGLVLFGFCSVWVPLVTDLKVIQFIWMLDPAAQISMICCAYSTVFISNSLVCNDYQCTWLEHKKWKDFSLFQDGMRMYFLAFTSSVQW